MRAEHQGKMAFLNCIAQIYHWHRLLPKCVGMRRDRFQMVFLREDLFPLRGHHNKFVHGDGAARLHKRHRHLDWQVARGNR